MSMGATSYVNKETNVSWVVWIAGGAYYVKDGHSGSVISYPNPETAIQSALTATGIAGGGTVHLKPGIYDCTATGLAINYSNVILEGEGRGSTIIRTNSGVPTITIGDNAARKYSDIIRDLMVWGRSYTVDSSGIRLNGCTMVILSNVNITGYKKGLYIDTSSFYGGANGYYEVYIESCQWSVYQDGTLQHNANTFSGIHVIAPGASVSGSIGIYHNYGNSNSFLNCSIDSAETGVKLPRHANGEGQKSWFYGLREEACNYGVDFVAADGGGWRNRFYGGVVAGYSGAVINNVESNANIFYSTWGYWDVNRGSATIGITSTSVVVTHGCPHNPDASEINVTLTNLPTNDIGDVYVTTITSSNFTINCRNTPGAATAVFKWSVNRTLPA